MKKTLRVVLPQGCNPSDMIEVMSALTGLEDKFEVVVDFEKPPGVRQDGPQLRAAPNTDWAQTESVRGAPDLFDIIDKPLPGVEEEEVNLRRRVVRDD